MKLTSPINNPLVVNIDESIDYGAIEPHHIKPAITFLMSQARATIEAVAVSSANKWEDVVSPIDESSGQLWRAWSVIGHLNAVVNTPALREAYNEMLGPISEFSTWVGLHEVFLIDTKH